MARFLNPFVLVFTALIVGAYVYVASRVAEGLPGRALLAVPFVAVWLIPMVFWIGEREKRSAFDDGLQYAGFIGMGWLSFVLVCTILRDVVWLAARLVDPQAADVVASSGAPAILGLATLGLALGAARAARGPRLTPVEIRIEGLAPGLDGFKIAQISDLHVGPTIQRAYVERVVAMTVAAGADLVALTGDIIDGPVARLAPHVEPLAKLKPAFFITGNHEYYAGASAWVAHLRTLGIVPLLNENVVVEHRGARLLVAGVVDPAVRMEDRAARPDPAAARGTAPADLTVLLAHNPKLAAAGEAAGFDLMLSGHTHAGQFHPWTFVARAVHAPHFAGVSRQGKMWVYVSAGTGSWGPPVRFGTAPELTVITLRKA